jgi:glycosyltransferase involved in cell wall biosynthesis
MIVDDGSTDNSWAFIQKYADHPQIEIYKKEHFEYKIYEIKI